MKKIEVIRDLVQAIEDFRSWLPRASPTSEDVEDAIYQAKVKLNESGYRYRRDISEWVKD